MSKIIPFLYDGKPVRFNSDGWINARGAEKRALDDALNTWNPGF